MKKAILATKVGMTQIFDENGVLVPVTVLQAGPCVVTQVKTVENDGYDAIQVGFGEKKERITTKDVSGKKVIRNPHGAGKAEVGHAKKANTTPKTFYREFRLDDCESLNVGDEIKVDIFAAGDKVDVSGISKGKGFAGPMKHGLHRGPMTHGSKSKRVSGSMGMCSNPGRVFKGKVLPGHMGVQKVTVQNLEVVKIDAEQNLILVKGAIPGNKGGLVTIRNSVKA